MFKRLKKYVKDNLLDIIGTLEICFFICYIYYNLFKFI